MTVFIRLATSADVPGIIEVEQSASTLFEEVGLGWIGQQPSSNSNYLEGLSREGTLWVAVQAETVVGFLAAHEMDGKFYFEEVDVMRSHQGQGIGTRLVTQAIQYATDNSFPALTLTTYRDLPWNAPFYAKLGFVELSADRASPGLLAQRQKEINAGHDPQRRCMMIKEL